MRSLIVLRKFHAKQCRDSFLQPHFCDSSPVLCSAASLSNFVGSLLLDLDPYGENDPDGMFTLFYNLVTRELVPKLAMNFRHLVTGGNISGCWRIADVAHVPKDSSTLDIGDYRPISITPALSKAFEKIVADKLCHF